MDFLSCVDSSLGKKARRQFEKALSNPMNEFHKRVILPQAYNFAENSYLGIAKSEFVPGRNHHLARSLHAAGSGWGDVTYFTNPMTIPPRPTLDENGKDVWITPKSRVHLGQKQVFTFEFDVADLSFCDQQLGWCRSATTGKPLDTIMGALFRHCSQFVDFEGITVAYSGNKSFHIHIVFDTANAKMMGIAIAIREGIHAHWNLLREIVLAILKPIDAHGNIVQPDMSMWEPEKFRRIPNGVRELDKTNLLGCPAGMKIKQVTIWEQFRARALKSASTSFFDPMLFVAAIKVARPVRRAVKRFAAPQQDDELVFCGAKMSAIYNDLSWPAFSHFAEFDGAQRAYFFNCADDGTPASYMDRQYSTVNVMGRNPHGLDPKNSPRLPRPLEEMMAEWIAEYHATSSRARTPAEEAFAMSATSHDAARTAIWEVIADALQRDKRSLICAPEGITKSTSLFTNHALVDGWVRADHDGLIMYAFADYNSACEKCRDFNDRQNASGFIGVVLESFDRTYKSVCERLDLVPITLRIAMESGFRSIWQAIERFQPAVISEFRQLHRALWEQIGTGRPVFFSVHAVAHHWNLSAPSRLMWSRSFWLTRGADDHTATCRSETALALLIHDEVQVENLVSAYPKSVVNWIEGMFAQNKGVWHGGDASSADRLADYDSYRAATPLPSGVSEISFDDVQDVYGSHGHDWTEVHPIDSGEYGPQNGGPYAQNLDRSWCLMDRLWPLESANKVMVLTTEVVPMTVARASHMVGWETYDLDTPLIPRDTVEAHPTRGVTGDNLALLVAELQVDHPGWEVISNRVAHIAGTITHASAKGSNLMIGKNVIQTMTFMPPAQFEYLEALNAWCRTDFLVRQKHVDEFNQSAGRNLGFRKQGGARHMLAINRRLFGLLIGGPRARIRYTMSIAVTTHDRRRALAWKNATPAELSVLKMMALRVKLKAQKREAEPFEGDDAPWEYEYDVAA